MGGAAGVASVCLGANSEDGKEKTREGRETGIHIHKSPGDTAISRLSPG